MNRVKGILITLGVLAAISSCSTQGVEANSEAKSCLYAAVIAYPTWNVANGPVLEQLTECKGLSPKDRTQLRSDVAAFVNKASKES